MTNAKKGPGGRPASTSHSTLERAAFVLFVDQGYDSTSVEDIASAAGIGRRTFFRYFQSKVDVVWGDFEGVLAVLRDRLAAASPTTPMMQVIREAVVAFNSFPPDEEPYHRERMTLILTVPTLYANSMLKFADWRAVIARFAAARLGQAPDDLLPVTIGYSALGASLAAYEQWLAHAGAVLPDLIDQAFGNLATGFTGGGTDG
jgi:mycofactocin system transcriptional regulator